MASAESDGEEVRVRTAAPARASDPVTSDRAAPALLFLIFLTLLGGRFTLDRVSADLSALDLRVVGGYLVLLLFLPWWAVWRRRAPRAAPDAVALGLFTAFCLYLVAAAAWAPPGARILTNVTDLLLMLALVAMSAAVASRMSPRGLQAVWWWLFLSALVYFSAAVYAGPGAQGRYSALGGGPNVFVRVMVLGVVAALALAVLRKQMWTLWTIPLFLAGAVLSGSRGGLAAFFLVLLVAARPLLRRLPRPVRRSVVAVGLLAAAAAPVVTPAQVTSTLAQRYVEQTYERQYDSGRSIILREAVSLFLENPLVGAGLDGYYGRVGQFDRFEYPHNLFVAVAAEAGTVGLVLLAGTLLAFVRTVRRHPPMSADVLFPLVAAGFVLVASMTSGDYYDSRFLWFFLVVAASASTSQSDGQGPSGPAPKGAVPT